MGLVTLTFDFLTLKLVCKSRETSFQISARYRPLGSRITRYVRDGRTDGHGRTKAMLIDPSLWGRGHNSQRYFKLTDHDLQWNDVSRITSNGRLINVTGRYPIDIFSRTLRLPDNSPSLFTWCRSFPPSTTIISQSMTQSDLPSTSTNLIAVHQLESRIQVSASFQKIPRPVGRIRLGPRVACRLGSGVWVRASF